MKELQQVVNNKVSQMVKDGVIQNLIEKGIESSIEKALKSEFESYGSITKQIKKALEEGLKINTSDLPFVSYNAQMLVAVKQKIGDLFAGKASERFMQEMDKLLEEPPEEITAKNFIETIVGIWKTEDFYDFENIDEYATVEIENNEDSALSGITIKIWKKHESRFSGKNQADIQLYVIDGKLRISHRQAYNPTCFSGEEAYIFKLYSAGTTITGLDDFDPDDCDLLLRDNEQ